MNLNKFYDDLKAMSDEFSKQRVGGGGARAALPDASGIHPIPAQPASS